MCNSAHAIYILGTKLLFSHSVISSFLRPCGLQHARLPLSIVSWSLLKLMSIELVMLSKHFILCHPLLLLLSIFLSIRVFSNELALHIRWPEYWNFSFIVSPSNEYSGLISYRIDWFGLLAVQGTLKSLLQHHSLKASVLQCSAFFMIQLSHPYMTTGKIIALTRWTFVSKWCLYFLIHCLGLSLLFFQEQASFNFMAAVTICSDFGDPQNKVCHCFRCFPTTCLPLRDGTGCHDLHFLNVEF